VSEALHKHGIEAEVRLGDPEVDVPGDADQIQQVCLNLFMNAVHAMPAGGRLRVTLEVVTRRKEGLDAAAPAEYVMLEIADTGRGISRADRDRIFEPFFTTKDEGQGTGLGLTVSHGIVKDHDGWIEVESPRPQVRTLTPIGTPVGELGGQLTGPPTGTAFRIFLPRRAATAGGDRKRDTGRGMPVQPPAGTAAAAAPPAAAASAAALPDAPGPAPDARPRAETVQDQAPGLKDENRLAATHGIGKI
jgi:hypothetical protein